MAASGTAGDLARAVLLALADLTPKPGAGNDSSTVPTDWFTWLPNGLALFGPVSPPAGGAPVAAPAGDVAAGDVADDDGSDSDAAGDPTMAPTARIPRDVGDRLAAIQQVRSGTPLRVGWLWVAGTTEMTDDAGNVKRRRVLQPLVVRPVRVEVGTGRLERGARLVATGDIELSPRIPPEARAGLADELDLGGGALGRLDRIDQAVFDGLTGLRDQAMRLAAAAGFEPVEILLEQPDADRLVRRSGVRLVIGVALYCTEETETVTRGNTLRTWATGPLAPPTAFHTVYAGSAEASAAAPGPLETTMPLSAPQRAAAERARAAQLTVLTGAPGTGKSHTIAAAVSDALRHGESVLVTAKTDAAVDALIDLLQRHPGPDPVVFGSNERRAQLAARLAGGQLVPAAPAEVDAAAAALDGAIAERDRHRAGVVAAAEAELAAVGRSATATAVRAAYPGLFDGGTEVRALLGELPGTLADIEERLRGSWWARRKAVARLRDLAAQLGANDDTAATTTTTALADGYALVTAMSAEATVDPTASAYRALEASEEVVRTCLGRLLAVSSRSPLRLDRPRLMAVAALATALRAGREARRAQLERLAGDELIQALPLWIGTLGDVDDLLPPRPALFDVVVIDEASFTEQTLAAPALLRAKRAIIAGDPRQLRHVSFVADDVVASVLSAHGLAGTPAAAVLDLRRNSTFDAAAAAAPVSRLDEHQRCDPHLVDVVAERLYPGELTVATRSPVTESHDCIHVERLPGERDDAGVVQAEVEHVLAELHRLHEAGERSVAVVSPFRAQVEAIEARVLAELPTSTILELDLRIGTAHGMQGNERDTVICSVGLGERDRNARRFAEDEHLLAVLLTRARRQLVLLLSYEPDAGSVLAEYVARSDSPPGRPTPAAELAPWITDLAGELRRAGLDLAHAYPVGRHVIDLATRTGDVPVAVVTGIHADGVDAHLERHLALLRRGWRVIQVPEPLWGERPGETALEVGALLRSGPTPLPPPAPRS